MNDEFTNEKKGNSEEKKYFHAKKSRSKFAKEVHLCLCILYGILV